VLVKIVIIFLLFVTAWVILILGSRHMIQRGSLARGLRRQPPAATGARALPAGIQAANRGPCCLEVPCSDECARRHQEMQDRLAQRYDLVAAEALKVIGQTQDTAALDS
jgi:hypothetical protein